MHRKCQPSLEILNILIVFGHIQPHIQLNLRSTNTSQITQNCSVSLSNPICASCTHRLRYAVISWSVVDGALRKLFLPLPAAPWSSHSSPLHAGVLLGLSSHRSSVFSHCHCEFLCAAVPVRQENTVPFSLPAASASYTLSG